MELTRRKKSSLTIDPAVCVTLEEKFKNFVRERCLIPDDMFDRISDVYRDLFNRIWDMSKSRATFFRQFDDSLYRSAWYICVQTNSQFHVLYYGIF